MRDFTWLPKQLAPNQGLAITFWIVFARFEFALKRENYATGDQNSVSAHWDKLATDLNGVWNADQTPELRAAVNFILNKPPNKQVLQGNSLVGQMACFKPKSPS